MPEIRTFMDMQELREKLGTIVPGGMQFVDWTWRDAQAYTSGTTTELNFFTAVNSNKVTSNMVSAGSIPSPEWFIIRAIRIVPLVEPTYENISSAGGFGVDAVRDMYRLLFNSRLVVSIGSSTHIDMISANFPAGQGLYGFATSNGASGATTVYEADLLVAANNGVPDPRCTWTLNHPKLLEPNLNFQVSMKWNSAETLSGNHSVRVELDGTRIRPIQ